MKIQRLAIDNIGGIPHLELEGINSHMNIICGSNGVGKTNILNTVASAFNISRNLLKKRVDSELGRASFAVSKDNGSLLCFDVETRGFDPDSSADPNLFAKSAYLPYNSVVYIKTNRVFDYMYLAAIERAPDPEHFYDIKDPIEGASIDDLKNWFIHTHLMSGAGDANDVESYNINKAKGFISALDGKFSFSKVTKLNEIMVSTPAGEVYFEYLSSGFKSAFFILLGILKEIEYKHGLAPMPANEYDGVILIDEIELHLHPEWQSKIIKILKQEFPKAQFFITTHSPHIIQSAEYNEIIALDKREVPDQEVPFEVYQRELPASLDYGFQGWTVEEILTDVMGMKTTSGAAYDCQMAKFNQALENGDKRSAEEAYSELSKMLHPNSHVRKMLQLEMIGLG